MQPDISTLLTKLAATGMPYDFEKIMRAFEFARELHDGQFRKSGEEYICHPIAVAEIVASLELDTDSICAAFLHDVIEDCPDKVDLATITKQFGGDVAALVDGLSKLVTLQLA
ncbi:MAG: bifunctional (p)ppGpp synthetase/guanosine-3',5'-bis(diphosphate) 3'-pyrophosphohydrolase, partial [Clostridia bacterium]|nr:bifunctional (p)ppGpp synthetase/guanosine-3',5'-bis(diphosphate) 3'-pyrophosphohydrolase [Clostridia bacterium]